MDNPYAENPDAENGYNVTPLISAEGIDAKVEHLAQALCVEMTSDWVVVALMDGALVFAADLMRALYRHGINPAFENMTLSSYGDDIQSAGQIKVLKGLSRDVSGRSVLLIDDVFETGLTLSHAAQMLKDDGARTVKTCVFAYKDGYSGEAALPDFKGWDAPDAFLVGYGMDFKGQYRGLPFIGDLLGSS